MCRPTHSHNRFAVIIMMLLVMSLAGCASAKTTKQATKAFVTYTNTTYGFSIRYPAGWQHEINPPSHMAAHPDCDFAIIWSKPVPDGGTLGGLGVLVSRWKHPLAPAQMKARRRHMLAALRRDVGRGFPGSPNLRVERVTTERTSGGLAILVHGRNRAARQLYDQFVLFHAGILYVVTFSGTKDDFATTYRGLPDTFTLR